MPGRGAQTFKKRQKEQERKERQQEKFAKRLERKRQDGTPQQDVEIVGLDGLPPPEEEVVAPSLEITQVPLKG